MNSDGEEVLHGGLVETVVRVGDTVRRSTGPWTPAVHALLRHLEAVDFSFAPRVLGIDEQGREVLTYIVGRPAFRPWPNAMLSDAGLVAIGHMLRELRSAVSEFVPPPDAVWRTQPVTSAQELRHGDVGPWNMIWNGDDLVGLIDWDFAEPAPPLWDIAQAAWYAMPIFGTKARLRDCGFKAEPDLRHRLRVLCGASDTDPVDVLDALADLQEVEQQRVAHLGKAGIAPFAAFLARGDVEQLTYEREKLANIRGALLKR
jgi:hypothetical protein